MIFSFGPVDVRFFSGKGWSNFELALVTERKLGHATRETAIRTGFKSEHLLELVGEEDPTDSIEVDGVTYYGRVSPGIDGDAHTLSAEQVYARIKHAKDRKQAVSAANAAAAAAGATKSSSNGTKPQPAAA